MTYQTIIENMGGESRLRVMVGAECFILSKGFVMFKHMGGWVRIEDQKHGDGTLKMEFMDKAKNVTDTVLDIWENELQRTFEMFTGLELRL